MDGQLTLENVRRIADLARLKLTDDEVVRYQKELVKILKAFENLSDVPVPADLAGDARSALQTSALGNKLTEQLSRMRPDVVESLLTTKDLMAGTPDKEGAFVRVPAILDRST